MYSKIMALWRNALVAASTNTTFTPTNMQFTYSNANWITAAKRVAMLNNVGVRQVVAFGDLLALSHVLPANANGANTNLDAALADALGADWARYGYAGEFMGVRLFPIDNAIVPGTQNTTIRSCLQCHLVGGCRLSASKPITSASRKALRSHSRCSQPVCGHDLECDFQHRWMQPISASYRIYDAV